MQLKQIDQGRSEEEMARAMENRDLKIKSEQEKQDIAKLENDMEKDQSTTSAMAKLRERKLILRKQLDELETTNPEETDSELQKRIANCNRNRSHRLCNNNYIHLISTILFTPFPIIIINNLIDLESFHLLNPSNPHLLIPKVLIIK